MPRRSNDLAAQLATAATRPLNMKRALAQIGNQERATIERFLERINCRDRKPYAHQSHDYRLAKDLQRAASAPENLDQLSEPESATFLALLGRLDAIERRIKAERAAAQASPTRLDTPDAASAFVERLPPSERAQPKPSQRRRSQDAA